MFAPLFMIDGYKLGHREQYPINTEFVVANWTPRYSRRNVTHAVLAGMQYVTKNVLCHMWQVMFFDRPKDEVVAEFRRVVKSYFGLNKDVDVSHIEALHDLGYLPIKIMALPEGSLYPTRVPGFIIFNTKKEFFWLTNYLETVISSYIWIISTSATTAKLYHDVLSAFALETVGNIDFVKFQAHDFSARGMHGGEAGIISDFGHLLSFVGTDTVAALRFCEIWYNANMDTELIGCSIPATEHSVMCAYGPENEEDAFNRLLDIYEEGAFAAVSDTYNFWNVVDPNGGLLFRLKDRIMGRNGKLVVRPDSGDPIRIVCGEAYPVKEISQDTIREALHKKYTHIRHGNTYKKIVIVEGAHAHLEEIPADQVTPVLKGAMQCLYETFGGTMSDKGFILLDSHIGLIYGDSITLERANEICTQLRTNGFASTNIVFGIGSYTYAYVTRDTEGYAIKATWVQVNGEAREIFKKPVTDSGVKNSAKGLVAVFKNADTGEYYVKDQVTWDEVNNCCFETIFEDGKIIKEVSLAEMRARLAAS